MTRGLTRILAIAIAAPLGACGSVTDFGRVRSSLVTDDAHGWMGAASTKGPASDLVWKHQLTDEERKLRDLAYPLIEPPYDRNRWYSAVSELGANSRPFPYPERTAYASRLFTTAYRSQTARYNRLMEDIRNDVLRLEPFFATAQYVSEMDRKRGQALGYVSNLSREENDNTRQRMAENQNIVLWVQRSLRERHESYRVALERMVIAAPSPLAVEAERTLGLLDERPARNAHLIY